MIVATVLLSKIFAPLVGFLQVLPGLSQAVGNWKKIGVALSALPMVGAGPQDDKEPALALRDLSVKDDIEDRTVLRDLNLDI